MIVGRVDSEDKRRWDELVATQTRLCGYEMHVWTWKDEDGVVHLLRYQQSNAVYRVRCTNRGLDQHVRVPFTMALPNCVWCVCSMAR